MNANDIMYTKYITTDYSAYIEN